MGRSFKGATATETHSAILDLIRSCGTVSRTELVERSGLTGASISRIVRQLIVDGLVIESGYGDATGGKRRTLLQLHASARHAVGISLDAVRITIVITDLAGRVVARRAATGVVGQPPRRVIDRLAVELRHLLEHADIAGGSVLGIGIAVPGRQDRRGRVLRSNPHATEWELFATESTLSAATGLPVVIENDSTCAAIGEYWVGRIPASADVATIYLADGFGLGLVMSGDVYRGASANVGEIGHMVLQRNGPACWCGNRGCLEALAAPKAMVQHALTDASLATALGLTGAEQDTRADADRITTAARDGEPRALAVVDESADCLATALVSLTNLLDLDQIILAGPGFAHAGGIYLETARRAVDRFSFVRNVHATQIDLSTAGADSAAMGAASLVLHSRLTPHHTSTPLALAD